MKGLPDVVRIQYDKNSPSRIPSLYSSGNQQQNQLNGLATKLLLKNHHHFRPAGFSRCVAEISRQEHLFPENIDYMNRLAWASRHICTAICPYSQNQNKSAKTMETVNNANSICRRHSSCAEAICRRIGHRFTGKPDPDRDIPSAQKQIFVISITIKHSIQDPDGELTCSEWWQRTICTNEQLRVFHPKKKTMAVPGDRNYHWPWFNSSLNAPSPS